MGSSSPHLACNLTNNQSNPEHDVAHGTTQFNMEREVESTKAHRLELPDDRNEENSKSGHLRPIL
jgi:hypothetical protein